MSSKRLKIISTVPSQTELLYDLKLEEEVIGITKFCIHPNKWFKNKLRIGGTKTLDLDKILPLKPDLIIANKEENDKAQIEALSEISEVFVSDIKTIEDSILLCNDIAQITNRIKEGKALCSELNEAYVELKKYKHSTAAYIIWNNPIMTIGHAFIHSMLNHLGFENIFGDRTRYPEIELEELRSKSPEYILLSSEPFPFAEKHRLQFDKQFPNSRVLLVDGEAFSWYGSRVLKKKSYLKGFHS